LGFPLRLDGAAGETEGEVVEFGCALSGYVIRALKAIEEFLHAAQQRLACRCLVTWADPGFADVANEAASEAAGFSVDMERDAVVRGVEAAGEGDQEISFSGGREMAGGEGLEVLEDRGEIGVRHRAQALRAGLVKEPAEEGGDPVHAATITGARRGRIVAPLSMPRCAWFRFRYKPLNAVILGLVPRIPVLCGQELRRSPY
jgi:hypothetical protein